MYVNPVLAGVCLTVLAELICLVVLAVFRGGKRR